MSAAPIRLLPPDVADAIAAGEVVERPAAVVKELGENAVDAGAHRIDIGVDGAGTVRIRVSDDGCGIPAGELRLAVARHATSKIRRHDDLTAIRTLGFRGEALASIAAVSDLVVVSCAGGAAGARLRVRAGEIVEEGPAGAPPGTTVEVRDLFFNTPARLRFLRSARSETAAAVRAAADLALTNPSVAVTCRVDGRVTVRTPGGGGLEDAVRAVLGAEAAELIALEAPGDVAVSGAISEPRRHRGSPVGLALAVNGRRIHHRSLQVAVAEAYRGMLPTGRHPFGLVCVDIDPGEVDVNVHPTKREVRFRDERRVFAAVQRACWAALQGARMQVASFGAGWDAPGAGAEGPPPGWASAGTLEALDADAAPAPRSGAPGVRADDGRTAEAAAGSLTAGAAPASGSGGEDSLGGLAPLRPMGQSGGRWMVAESARGIVLVDPHAAHEKVLYAQLLAAWGPAGGIAGRSRGAGGSQLLLIPAVVPCDGDQLARLEAHADLVAGCGFAVEPFGPGLVRCTAVPTGCERADPARLVLDLLDALGGGDVAAGERRHRLAAMVACHGAVRFGDVLSEDEQRRLLDRLVVTPGGTTCPHGRPTVLVLDEPTLRRAFRRPV